MAAGDEASVISALSKNSRDVQTTADLLLTVTKIMQRQQKTIADTTRSLVVVAILAVVADVLAAIAIWRG